MKWTRPIWRPRLLLVALVLGATATACGAKHLDDAQQALNREAHEHGIENLTVVETVLLVADRSATDEATERAAAAEDPAPLADADDTYQPSTDELDAIAMAQDAHLELLNGDVVRGRELLEASMNLHPTVDALEPLAELLAADQDDATLAARCRRTRAALRDDTAGVIEVLRLCYTHHSSDDVDTALGWASHDDRTRFKAILTP